MLFFLYWQPLIFLERWVLGECKDINYFVNVALTISPSWKLRLLATLVIFLVTFSLSDRFSLFIFRTSLSFIVTGQWQEHIGIRWCPTCGNVMVFGGGAFGRWLGYESGALMNGINAFVKGTLESSSTLSALCPHSEKLAAYEPGCGTHQTLNLLEPWSWSHLADLWEINFCRLQVTPSVVFLL